MGEAGQRLGFAHQPRGSLARRFVIAARPNHLERDAAIEGRVIGRIDFANSSGPDSIYDQVPSEQLAWLQSIGLGRRCHRQGGVGGAHCQQLRAQGAASLQRPSREKDPRSDEPRPRGCL